MFSKANASRGFGSLEIILAFMMLIPILIGFVEFSRRLSTQHLLDQATALGADFMAGAPLATSVPASGNNYESIDRRKEDAIKQVKAFLTAADQSIQFECDKNYPQSACATLHIEDLNVPDNMNPSKKLSAFKFSISYKQRSVLGFSHLIQLDSSVTRAEESNFQVQDLPDITLAPIIPAASSS